MPSLAVKNSYEFCEKIKNIELEESEIIVSFDVTQLFPSIPANVAIDNFEKHLKNVNVPPEKRFLYLETAKTCMNQNYFQFRDSYYKIEHGTTMGNPLSPFIAECFMSVFEIELKKQNLLPRIWHRYVDDIFAVVEALKSGRNQSDFKLAL